MSLVTGVRRQTRLATTSSAATLLHTRRPEDLVHLDVQLVPTTRQVMTGTAAWMSLVFVLVYGVLTASLDVLGLYPGMRAGWQADLASFALMLPLTLGLVAVLKPRLELPRFGPVVNKDPVRWAVMGGFGTWALAHCTIPGLWPLFEMPAGQLVSLVGLNLVEHGLFGLMLASFVQSRKAALGLGALFALTFLGIWVFLRLGLGL
jgi:hypothetical protein